jgi:hypothetical protein
MNIITRKFIPMVAAVGFLAAACTSSEVTQVQQDLTNFENSVRAGAVVACGFLPEFNSIAAILQAEGIIGTITVSVDAMVQTICNAVTGTGTTLQIDGQSLPVVTINGHQIIIHGKFVQ